MAAAVARHAGRAACLLVAGAAALATAPAGAEVLIDPTRSPLASPGAPASAAPAPAARLQMILRGPGETRTAVIDGASVRVGDKVRLPAGSARVERITDTSVELARGSARETLQLLPGLARAVSCTQRESGTQRPAGC